MTFRISPIGQIGRMLQSPWSRGGEKEDQAERVISATELNMLPCVHPWSIDVVVYHDPSGRIHLGRGLALRCFQRLSLPNIATQRCRGRDNWNTSGSSDPVLSY